MGRKNAQKRLMRRLSFMNDPVANKAATPKLSEEAASEVKDAPLKRVLKHQAAVDLYRYLNLESGIQGWADSEDELNESARQKDARENWEIYNLTVIYTRIYLTRFAKRIQSKSLFKMLARSVACKVFRERKLDQRFEVKSLIKRYFSEVKVCETIETVQIIHSL